MIRVLLADDEPAIRAGWRTILSAQPDIAVLDEAGDGVQCVRLTAATRPDVVVMDVRMPRLDGVAATRRIADGAAGTTRVLVVTLFDLDEYVFGALCAGASGFLLKDVTADRLVAAVRTIAGGDGLFAPAAVRRLVRAYARVTGLPAGADHGLTPRELEVLRGIAAGRSNAELAGDLTLSTHTVKTHVASILAKLGQRDRVQAVVYAYRNGLAG
ncbi:MAG TPA: response regulator transcription factor [Rugosimonospora sp.]|nr:response regulator transcription factor [Rugosimonospora sp.]